MSKPMPTDITREQVVEWLENERKDWLWAIEHPEYYGDLTVHKKTLSILDAILAALAEPELVTEGERKKMLVALDDSKIFRGWHGRQFEFNAIRALILGNYGGAVTEKFIEKWAKVFVDKFIHGRAGDTKSIIREMLREAGVAGKAETPSHTAYSLAGMPDKGEDDE